MNEIARGVGFEGSYLGADAKISPKAVMECKICWTPYDPDVGDDIRQIEPGTPFLALPADWKCPTCDAPKEQFMVLSDPGAEQQVSEAASPAFQLTQRVAALEAEFREIHNAKMRNLPFANKALHVEAIGFQVWNGQPVGVLIAPWFMNLMLLPGEGVDWSTLSTGDKELISFPSGVYEFIHTKSETLGGIKGCSLFSPMAEFTSQLQATDVAKAVMAALFDEANREVLNAEEVTTPLTQPEPDDDEVEAVIAETVTDPEPSRRALFTGNFSKSDPDIGQSKEV